MDDRFTRQFSLTHDQAIAARIQLERMAAMQQAQLNAHPQGLGALGGLSQFGGLGLRGNLGGGLGNIISGCQFQNVGIFGPVISGKASLKPFRPSLGRSDLFKSLFPMYGQPPAKELREYGFGDRVLIRAVMFWDLLVENW